MQTADQSKIEIFKVRVSSLQTMSDTITPVSAFLSLRDKFSVCLLLESADYRGSENSRSFICVNPILQFRADRRSFSIKSLDNKWETNVFQDKKDVLGALSNLLTTVSVENADGTESIGNGFFGYSCYDAVQFFEDISLNQKSLENKDIPLMHYALYEFVLVFNHFNQELCILHNRSNASQNVAYELSDILRIISQSAGPRVGFSMLGPEIDSMSDEDHIDIIKKCKEHIARGDVFQIVPSRCFSQKFKGDDFLVYRHLRAINPSPYLFYFDYGEYKIFGSSPEAQIVIEKGKASIYPIAGTYRRSADRTDDNQLAEALALDPKENAEHVMLVDLARNDLSIHCNNVKVEVFKEIQFYSHVIHLVSKVTGFLRDKLNGLRVMGDTFPAGTLSGAPKYKAMQLIDKYERGARSFYGGCLGFFDTKGNVHQAIMIRSFLSKNNTLSYQAGSGIVFDSDPESEVQEVRNKLGALRRAIELASKYE